jgi:DNA-binding NtrC family response regulator
MDWNSSNPVADAVSAPPARELIAVLDTDPAARGAVRTWLERAGHRVVEHDSGRSLLEEGGGEAPAVVCVELEPGHATSFEALELLRARDPDLTLIVVTAQREVEPAVAAMRAGAYDYLTKPLDEARLLVAVGRALERRHLLRDVRRLESALSQRVVPDTMVGRSDAMRVLSNQVARVLESDVAVCIVGESGTGKELVARAIHQGGPRRHGPFVTINCAGIPATLQESELFGHERGAFTGATHTRRGRFEQAHGGTLLLDEVGEMSLTTQASLLRALQEKTIRRVGGPNEIPVDVRIVCATHRDLRREVEAGRFREDLFFRLVVYPIQIPPLCERRDDIPLLVGHFLRRLQEDVGREIRSISPEALEALARYDWPGNVRELQNVVHRSMLACRGDEIVLADLPADLRGFALQQMWENGEQDVDSRNEVVREDEIEPLEELERRAIQRALKATKGSVTRAAKLLGIGRATLYRRIQTFSKEVA